MVKNSEQRVENISVIIPSYNRPKIVLDTIDSLMSGEVVPAEILVVDQSEKPLCVEREFLNSDIRVIYMDSPSATKARNVGIEEAKHDVLLFCDDDILVNDDTLKLLYEKMSREEVALVAAIDYDENPRFAQVRQNSLPKDVVASLMGMKSLKRHRSGKGGYVIKSNMRGRYAVGIRQCENTDWAMGFFFCMKKSLLDRWKIRFDEKLGRYSYAEDLDFSMRYCGKAQSQGFLTLVEPELYVNHLVSKEWRTPSDEKTFYVIANRRYLSYKNFPNRHWYRFALNWYDSLYAFSQVKDKSYRLQLQNSIALCNRYKKEIRAGEIQELLKDKISFL